MHEPNLQSVPRDFKSEGSDYKLSTCITFIPDVGNVLLTADYCELELRIMAHFSKYSILCKLLKEPGDVFKSMAALVHNINEDEVLDYNFS